ncbi:hypothetical protein PPTG_10689 [Phytophthora nicotianae INRA-310]|uniref:RxLR effector protein n=2 Tax=Phytophthora nicotianae TaxID=4792 RepID=W2QE77_PHYN3|nr:hypothetical protein PPTG_10689 [Phytophthora nicotianae INRA-310]ETN10580.1 hypothetical protein PPTG_10689 [Phytophthora nicotianae INRA-310]
MRLSYIFPVVIAAILHASGSALPTTMESNQATLANEASPGIHGADAGRLLRGVDKDAVKKEDLVQEERSVFKNLGKSSGKYLKKFGHWLVWKYDKPRQ